MFMIIVVMPFRFRHLEKMFPDQVRELSTLFRFHAASIEMERMNIMADVHLSSQYKEWLCQHFDSQLHQVCSYVYTIPNSSLQSFGYTIWYILFSKDLNCFNYVYNSHSFLLTGCGPNREESLSAGGKREGNHQAVSLLCSWCETATTLVKTCSPVDGKLVSFQLTSSISNCHRLWSTCPLRFHQHWSSQEMVWQQTQQAVQH